MIYKIHFKENVLKSWKKLDSWTRNQFLKKLEKLKSNPEIPKNKLSWFKNKYKIKLKEKWLRLIYETEKEKITITIIKIWKREKWEAYNNIE